MHACSTKACEELCGHAEARKVFRACAEACALPCTYTAFPSSFKLSRGHGAKKKTRVDRWSMTRHDKTLSKGPFLTSQEVTHSIGMQCSKHLRRLFIC
ncbi:hypothetical protein DUNSADRAFT_10040 [Dunaliella salina]|uniref:Encoded protein n=1 Tax=Dunaliella salina TaxID=3046 RepID=A0ABQ7GG51_DUNSA|nr:hypothetical protein DUNSADRAFT_10040 [Dunaliella salina]|eukprot:KAF5833589.1 hypothetical protein DUNSADRAFT_10040 [Dunaliella salina]